MESQRSSLRPRRRSEPPRRQARRPILLYAGTAWLASSSSGRRCFLAKFVATSLPEILRCINHLSGDPNCLETLQRTDAIKHLIPILELRDGPLIYQIHSEPQVAGTQEGDLGTAESVLIEDGGSAATCSCTVHNQDADGSRVDDYSRSSSTLTKSDPLDP